MRRLEAATAASLAMAPMALADGNSKIDPKQKLKPDQTQQVDAPGARDVPVATGAQGVTDVQARPLDPPHS